MISEVRGNLLADDADALVNTVNTVGVMGKGIALQVQARLSRDVQCLRARSQGRPSGAWPHARLGDGSLTGPRYIINFPTKRHWKAGSRIEDVEAGLADLVRVVRDLDIRSVAMPPLGCGNGGLDWGEVAPRIRTAFEPLADEIDVRVYVPAGAPPAREMRNRSPAPKLTAMRGALLQLMSAYHCVAWEWPGPVETQKLAYFLQEAGEPMRLSFAKGPYGPYADDLRRTLRDLEGHFITGFGDGSARPLDAEPLEVTPTARESLSEAIGSAPATATRTARVLDLVSGFEGVYDLELLASVHWVVTREGARTPDDASRVIRQWTARKGGLFHVDHVTTAWQALDDKAWLSHRADV